SGPGSSGLPLPFSGEVFLLGVAQRRRQLRISAVVGQEQDLRIRLTTGGRSWLVRRGPLPPMRPRLQPEDLRRDIAALRVSKQRTGDRRIGLRHAAIEFITQALAQRFRGTADDPGDVVLTDTDARQVA